MDAIRRFQRPALRRPRALVAFEGWNDACEAASGALTYLLGQADAGEPFAVIDPEEFFDFQEHRPTVEITEGGTRRLVWPTTRFHSIAMPGDTRDLVIVLGEEPSFRWKTFARCVTQVLNEADVEEVILMGAFIGQVPHRRPVPIVGGGTSPRLLFDHGLPPSSYEGPTGIIGVLQEACREVGLPAVSLWAATPHYLAANPNPKAMLALLDRAASVAGFSVDRHELEAITSEFDERVEEALADSDDLAEYVTELEDEAERNPAARIDPALSNELVTEIEDFLKDR
jgi:proteasome assembly chaperone (PAC2) family protein